MGTADLMTGVNLSYPEEETYKHSEHHTEEYDTQK